ncbi:cation transporter [Flavobacterium sp. DGU11]|uniref:Cation transporter n=1 Tax=Flavobacterium arundinis TaxID=3139143 RepID=A0ABU9HU68_9FLAO
MKKLILILLITLSGLSVQAQEKKDKNAKHEIEVKGNCDQCKKRIEKAAYGVKGVKSAVWHEDHQDLHLIIDETKCSLDDVRAAIAKAGHDTDTVKATNDDYNNLHSCCHYDRG